MLILFLFHIHTPDCLRSLESAKQGKLRCLNRSFTSPWRLGSLSCPVNLGTALVGCGFAQFDSPTHRWPRWSDRCSWSKEGSFYWRCDFAASYKRDIERKGDEVVEWTEWKNESEKGLFEEDWSFRWVEWTAPIRFNLSNIEITTLLRGSKFSRGQVGEHRHEMPLHIWSVRFQSSSRSHQLTWSRRDMLAMRMLWRNEHMWQQPFICVLVERVKQKHLVQFNKIFPHVSSCRTENRMQTF